MAANVIRAEYDTLAQIAAQFAQQAEQSAQMTNAIVVLVDQLESGAWIGVGANSFYSEMNDLVFPALRRLIEVLGDAGGATKRISEALKAAEDEAASLFKGSSEGGAGGAVGQIINQIGQVGSRVMEAAKNIFKGGDMPLHVIDMTNLNNVDPQAIVRQINPEGRPVVFMIHGFNNSPESARAAFESAAAQMREMYAHLPPEKRPILVGVNWDAETIGTGEVLGGVGAGSGIGGGLFGIPGAIGGAIGGGVGVAKNNYDQANVNAVATGQKFGEILETFNEFYPESKVNVMAHSLGNRMFMEAVASSDVKVDRYLAIQGAVNRSEISTGGRYSDVLGSEINSMTATYTSSDMAMYVHKGFGYGTGLGNDAVGINRPNYTAIDLDSKDKWFDINHYGLEDPRLFNVINDVFTH
ncbi:MAG: WXG100 family type VII secretion target [Anaerolinea sp.]|nr:WXG100 family type VII secretion target [Anaerolinea sp.]MCC6976616.1 WXG100 family type VII secretion target [Anaerolineae bacterium]CAG1001588.1 hypothetical protein ANRL4_03190 [Anaerolineae bacterium]